MSISSPIVKNDLVCVLCQREYTMEKYLEVHFRTNHKQQLPGYSLRKSDLYFCQKCKCYSQSGDSHLCSFDNTRVILRFSCDTCDFFSYHKQGLRYHYRIKHPNLVQPKMFQSIPAGDLLKDRCDDCGKWVTRLKRHKCKGKVHPVTNRFTAAVEKGYQMKPQMSTDSNSELSADSSSPSIGNGDSDYAGVAKNSQLEKSKRNESKSIPDSICLPDFNSSNSDHEVEIQRLREENEDLRRRVNVFEQSFVKLVTSGKHSMTTDQLIHFLTQCDEEAYTKTIESKLVESSAEIGFLRKFHDHATKIAVDQLNTHLNNPHPDTVLYNNLTVGHVQDIISGQDLNKAVIDRFLGILQDRCYIVPKLPKLFVFTTEFYSNYVRSGDLAEVEDVDFTNVDCVLCPVYIRNAYWSLVSFNQRSSTLSFLCGFPTLDVMEKFEVLKNFEEILIPLFPKIMIGLTKFMGSVPSQNSPRDCGIMICEFAELISQGQSVEFKSYDSKMLRYNLALRIVSPYMLFEK